MCDLESHLGPENPVEDAVNTPGAAVTKEGAHFIPAGNEMAWRPATSLRWTLEGQ
jgi:hypothetical protein